MSTCARSLENRTAGQASRGTQFEFLQIQPRQFFRLPRRNGHRAFGVLQPEYAVGCRIAVCRLSRSN